MFIKNIIQPAPRTERENDGRIPLNKYAILMNTSIIGK
jgi:hypothetical protein